MLPDETLPHGLGELLQACRSCFSTRSFPIFCLLVVGAITQVGPTTVTGILIGAGIQHVIGHDRVHRFFSEHRWDPDQLGLALARIIISRLLAPDAPIVLVIDDTLFRRRGRKVAHVHYCHDASAPGRAFAHGNRWVILAVVVDLPFCTRPVSLPVLFRLWHGKDTTSCPELARTLVGLILRAYPDRHVHVVADAGYRGGALAVLPARADFTTRPAANSVFYDLPGPRTGRPGRPRVKGQRLGTPAQVLAGIATALLTVSRYGRTETVAAAERICLWHGAFGTRTGRLICVRELQPGRRRAVLYLYTTDLHTPLAQLIERYAARWSIETGIGHGKQHIGAGQARNRTPAAVARTVPFMLHAMTIVYLWYALYGHHDQDAHTTRTRRPWYTTKTEPAFTDMLAKLRKAIITARISAIRPGQTTPQQIDDDLLTWVLNAA
jgi:hypothetical protein